MSRTLQCQRCQKWVQVFEASMVGPHKFLDATRFVCGGCLEAEGLTVTAPVLGDEIRKAAA